MSHIPVKLKSYRVTYRAEVKRSIVIEAKNMAKARLKFDKQQYSVMDAEEHWEDNQDDICIDNVEDPNE